MKYLREINGKMDCYHCHLKRGDPTYVAVWKVAESEIKVIVEIKYAGTHLVVAVRNWINGMRP